MRRAKKGRRKKSAFAADKVSGRISSVDFRLAFSVVFNGGVSDGVTKDPENDLQTSASEAIHNLARLVYSFLPIENRCTKAALNGRNPDQCGRAGITEPNDSRSRA